MEHDLRQSVSSLNALMSTLAGVDGKKILVLTSEGFPMQPGREIFTFIEDVARENVRRSLAQGGRPVLLDCTALSPSGQSRRTYPVTSSFDAARVPMVMR
mgnify:CR=1 FL=1